MADIFVKTTGNDGNDGSTWALAKLTVQAGLTAASTAGDRCIVAPGVYAEHSLTAGGPGTAGSHSKWIGDYAEAYADGGANTHGFGNGYVIVDASLTTGNKGYNLAQDLTDFNDNWAFWDWDGLFLTGGGNNYYGPVSGGVNWYGTYIRNCILVGGYVGLQVVRMNVLPDVPNDPLKIENCILIGKYSGTSRFECGFSFSTWPNVVSSFPSNPDVVLDRCIVMGRLAAINSDGLSNSVTYLKARNCLLYGFQSASGNAYVMWGQSASYGKTDTEDCVLYGYGARQSCAGSDTRPATYYSSSVAATLSKYPHLPPIPYLYPLSPIINANSSNGVFPDIWGTATQGDADYGAQEFVTGQYPLEPNMDISNLTTVTPGPSTGGGLSRGRVVNAGGI